MTAIPPPPAEKNLVCNYLSRHPPPVFSKPRVPHVFPCCMLHVARLEESFQTIMSVLQMHQWHPQAHHGHPDHPHHWNSCFSWGCPALHW